MSTFSRFELKDGHSFKKEELIKIGLEMKGEARSIDEALRTQILPKLSIVDIYENFGRVNAISEYRHRENCSIGEAFNYIKGRFENE